MPDPLVRRSLEGDRLRLRYSCAAALMHAGLVQEDRLAADDRFRRAEEFATHSIELMDRVMATVTRQPLAPAVDGPLCATTEGSLRPATQVLVAGAIVSTRDGVAQPRLELALGHIEGIGPDPNYRVRYNVACFWSSYADRLTNHEHPTHDIPPPELARVRAAHLLTEALFDAPPTAGHKLAAWARQDPSLHGVRDHRETSPLVVPVLDVLDPPTEATTTSTSPAPGEADELDLSSLATATEEVSSRAAETAAQAAATHEAVLRKRAQLRAMARRSNFRFKRGF